MSSDADGFNKTSKWNLEEIFSIAIVCVLFLTLSGCCSILRSLFCRLFRIFTNRNQVQRQPAGDLNLDEDPSMQLQSYGLEYSVVQSLPISQFKKSEGEHKPINVECAICLGEFEEGEWLKHLPKCSHSFHVSCIDTWFQSHSNCPLCRSFVHHRLLECYVASHTILETLRREDFFQERVDHFESVHSQDLAFRQQASSPG